MKNAVLPNFTPITKLKTPIEEIRQEKGWRLWLIAKPFDWVTTLLYLSSFAIFVDAFFSGTVRNWLHLALVTLAIVSLLLIDRLEFWFYGERVPPKLALGLLLLRLAIIVSVSFVPVFDVSYLLYAILPINFSLYFGMRGAYWATAIFWVLGVTQIIFFSFPTVSATERVEVAILYTLVTAFVLALARVITAEKELRLRAERMLDELGSSHRQIVELATNEERVRLARDIHDSLGHYLTVVNVQLEKTIAFHDREPTEALRAAQEAKRLAGEALQEVRRSVKTLRASPEPFSLSQALTQLVENMPIQPLKLELFIHGNEQNYSSQKLLELFRVGQEGLTNVQRHAAANKVTLSLNFSATEGTLTIEDDGRGFDMEKVKNRHLSGYGLIGLQERLETVGGKFQVHSQVGFGTKLIATVPKDLLV